MRPRVWICWVKFIFHKKDIVTLNKFTNAFTQQIQIIWIIFLSIADLHRIQKNWDSSIDYYMLAYNVNTLAMKALEQALQIALSTNKLKRAEEICELMHNDTPDNLDILNTYKDLTLYNQNYKKSLSFLKKLKNKLE